MRVFRLYAVEYHCPYDEDKVKDMLRGLGREEVESILAEQGEVVIRNEMCNHEYRFDARAIAELFADATKKRMISDATLRFMKSILADRHRPGARRLQRAAAPAEARRADAAAPRRRPRRPRRPRRKPPRRPSPIRTRSSRSA